MIAPSMIRRALHDAVTRMEFDFTVVQLQRDVAFEDHYIISGIRRVPPAFTDPPQLRCRSWTGARWNRPCYGSQESYLASEQSATVSALFHRGFR
jgi:hypothetical protein